ncbi:MFS transporter [Vibrio vulnificus]
MSSKSATLFVTVCGFFMITLNAVVVSVVLPAIQNDFSASMADMQWALNGYTLMFATMLLTAGVICDIFGARNTYFVGMATFIIASYLCGAATTPTMLIIARFVQGAAAAAMTPSSLALLRHAYTNPSQRTKAIAIWAMGGAIASTSGPIIGGLLSVISWRWVFYIHLPVGIISLWLMRYSQNTPKQPTSFDLLGQALIVIGLGSLSYAAIESGESGLISVPTIMSFLISLFSFTGFIVWQNRASKPMVPPSLFQIPNIMIANTVGFTFMFGYFGLPFLMSMYLQHVRGLTALQTGLVFLPMMLMGLILTPITHKLVARFGSKLLISGGLALMTIGLAAIALLAEQSSARQLSTLMTLVGLSGPLISPPITGVLLSSASDRVAGTASGLFNTFRQMGCTLAVAIFGALLAQPAGLIVGLQQSLYLGAAVAALTMLFSLCLSKD